MVDDQPSKLLSYEVMLGELGEKLGQGEFRARSTGTAVENGLRRRALDVSMPNWTALSWRK